MLFGTKRIVAAISVNLKKEWWEASWKVNYEEAEFKGHKYNYYFS